MSGKNELPEEVQYKGFVINPVPEELAESGHWTVDVEIENHRSSKVESKIYYSGKSCPTKDQALRYCFEYGRQIIDGEIPDLSVHDL
jgi:hypothetical protein